MALLIIVGIIVLCIVIFVGIIIHWTNTTDIESINQTYFKFIVKEGQVVDYNDFINPQDETSALDHIDESIRLQIADYMRENNLKLKEGQHYVRKKVISNSEDIGILDEHLKYFKFDKIE